MDNLKKNVFDLIMMVVVLCVVLSVGTFTFYNISGSVDWASVQNPEMYNNTVANVDTVFNVAPVMAGIAVSLIIIAIVISYISIPYSTLRENKFLKFFVSSAYYFGYGVIGLVCLLPPFALGYYLIDFAVVQGNTGSLVSIAKWLLLVIVLYFSISGFGYFFKKLIIDKFKKRMKEREYVKNSK